MKFLEHTLDNGLQVAAEVNPQAYSMAMGFFVRTGSRDEPAELAGVSHFLEHMAFKGTPRRSAADVNRELDEIGSHSNAETSEEHTLYYAAVLPEYQDRALDLLADIMRPSIRGEDFETEKQVILEEIAKYEDQPPFGAYEKALAAHFPDHPLGRPVLGTRQTVSAMSPEQMRGYFEKHYSPGNMGLLAAGQFDFDALVKLAEQLCGDWQPFDVERDTQAPPTGREFQALTKEIAMQQYVLLINDAPSTESPLRYASRLLCMILGDDSGSRLFWELIDSGRAEYAALFPHEYQGCGVSIGYLCCGPDDAQENLELMHQVLTTAQQEGITEEELSRAKNKLCSSLVLSSERPRSRLFSVGSRWLQRQPYVTVRQELDAYQAVTVDDIAGVLKQYPLTGGTIVSVGPHAHLTRPQAG